MHLWSSIQSSSKLPGFVGLLGGFLLGFLVGHFCLLQLPLYDALLLQCFPPLWRRIPLLLPPPQLLEHVPHLILDHLHAVKPLYEFRLFWAYKILQINVVITKIREKKPKLSLTSSWAFFHSAWSSIIPFQGTTWSSSLSSYSGSSTSSTTLAAFTPFNAGPFACWNSTQILCCYQDWR